VPTAPHFALERRRFDAHDLKFDDFGRRGVGETDDARDQNNGAQQMPHGVSPDVRARRWPLVARGRI
jgi:hypothetical protein